METKPPIFGVCFGRHDCSCHPLARRERTQHRILHCQVSRFCWIWGSWHSLGFNKKLIEYTNEVAKTDSFKFSPSGLEWEATCPINLQEVGVSNLALKAGTKYVIIPCTNDPKEATFALSVYATKDFEAQELTEVWPFSSSLKVWCSWRDLSEC